jgi:hypothetical protein
MSASDAVDGSFHLTCRIVETAGPETFFIEPSTDRALLFLARYGAAKGRA